MQCTAIELENGKFHPPPPFCTAKCVYVCYLVSYFCDMHISLKGIPFKGILQKYITLSYSIFPIYRVIYNQFSYDTYKKMNEWLNEWKIEWMKDWMNKWMKELMNKWINEWKNKWKNEWINELINEWKNELINEKRMN